MTTVFDISMSLDGYVTAAGVRPEEPMGDGGQQLHEWALGTDERGHDVLAESASTVGATIAGRRTYDLSVPWWGPDGPGGADRTPTFIVSHSTPGHVPEGSVYTFVNDPIERSEEHTSELQSRPHLVCRLLLEKKKNEAHAKCKGSHRQTG